MVPTETTGRWSGLEDRAGIGTVLPRSFFLSIFWLLHGAGPYSPGARFARRSGP